MNITQGLPVRDNSVGGGVGVDVTDAREEEHELVLPWPSPGGWHTLGPDEKDATGCPVIPERG